MHHFKRLPQILASSFVLAAMTGCSSIGFFKNNTQNNIAADDLHAALTSQLNTDVSAAKAMRADMITAQRKSQSTTPDALYEINKRKTLDKNRASIERMNVLNREAAGTFCGTSLEILRILSMEMNGRFVDGQGMTAGRAYATIPAGCIHGTGKTYIKVLEEVSVMADAVMDIRITPTESPVIEVIPKQQAFATTNNPQAPQRGITDPIAMVNQPAPMPVTKTLQPQYMPPARNEYIAPPQTYNQQPQQYQQAIPTATTQPKFQPAPNTLPAQQYQQPALTAQQQQQIQQQFLQQQMQQLPVNQQYVPAQQYNQPPVTYQQPQQYQQQQPVPVDQQFIPQAPTSIAQPLTQATPPSQVITETKDPAAVVKPVAKKYPQKPVFKPVQKVTSGIEKKPNIVYASATGQQQNNVVKKATTNNETLKRYFVKTDFGTSIKQFFSQQ